MSEFNQQHNRAVWFDIPVADLNRAQSFYRALLGVDVAKESFGDIQFCVIEHDQGNGGCLVHAPDQVSATTGVLLYLNVDGRIRDAVEQVESNGGRILEPIHPIGPHGFRAIIRDSEGNRLALHATTDV